MKLEELAATVEKKIEFLQNADFKSINMAEMAYAASNAQLKEQIAALKKNLTTLEMQAGELQFSLPTVAQTPLQPAKVLKTEPATASAPKPAPADAVSAVAAATKKPVKGGKGAGDNEAVDVSRLDMRVGRIMEVQKHPDADSLYVEQVNLGEDRSRTIVSGLVQHVPIEKMQNLTGIFMCNLKPVKMRGVESQGMLMCVTKGSSCQPLVLEGDVELGDRIFVEGYPGEPDAQLNPKKKVFEQVKPDLLVANHIATYKGVAWKVQGKPNVVIKAPDLESGQIS